MAYKMQQTPTPRPALNKVYKDDLEAEIDLALASLDEESILDAKAEHTWASLKASPKDALIEDAPREPHAPAPAQVSRSSLGGQDPYPQDPRRFIPAPSTPRRTSVYSNRSFIGPAYADPESGPSQSPDFFSRSGTHSHGVVPDPSDPAPGWRAIKEYRRRKPRVTESSETFSSYRNDSSHIEYPTERCLELGCWQNEPHTHDESERPLATPRRKRRYFDLGSDDDEGRQRAPKIAKRQVEAKDTGPKPSTLLDSRSSSIRQLKKALPSVTTGRIKFTPQAEQVKPPSVPTFALPLRPLGSVKSSERGKNTSPIPVPDQTKFSMGPPPPKLGTAEPRRLLMKGTSAPDPTAENIKQLLEAEDKRKGENQKDDGDENEVPEL